jgi:hypothetical protein
MKKLFQILTHEYFRAVDVPDFDHLFDGMPSLPIQEKKMGDELFHFIHPKDILKFQLGIPSVRQFSFHHRILKFKDYFYLLVW